MRQIVRWTVWQRRWSTFWWSFGAFAFIFLTLAVYPSFKDAGAELEKSFSNLSDSVLALFGGSSDFFSPIGFLNSQIFFLLLPLVLTMLAVALGAALIGREEQDTTLETLLARPISRGKVMAGKVIAGTVVLGIVSVVSLLTVVIGSRVYDLESVPSSAVALATFNSFLLAYATGAITFLLAATGRARGAAIGIGAFVGLGGYIIDSLSGNVHWLEGPSKFLPFHYFQSEAVLRQTYHWSNALFFVAILVICGALSYISFRRRDLV